LLNRFNIAYVSNPESYEDLVELLVPVLQKRGLMWDDYTVPGGTYRENLLGTPGQSYVPEGHPARQFRYEALKEKYGDANGDIVIDRTEPEPAPAPLPEAEKIVPAVEVLSVSEQPVAVKASA
jgi:hypothetical protein